MRHGRWIAMVLAGAACSAILGMGCDEKTSDDSPPPVEDTASKADSDGSGPVEIEDDWKYTPPPPASARR